MIASLLEEYKERGSSDYFLNEARQIFEENCEQRDEILAEFIKDFVESEEFEEYLKKKRDILKVNAATQYCDDDLIVQEEAIILEKSKTYPLTKQSRKMFLFARQFEKYVQNEEKRQFLMKQEKGIQLIRRKIMEFKETYQFTKELVEKKRQNSYKKYIREFCENFHINLSYLTPKSRNKMESKIVRYKKSLYNWQREKKKHILNVVKKLAAAKIEPQTKKYVKKTIKIDKTFQTNGKVESDFSEQSSIQSELDTGSKQESSLSTGSEILTKDDKKDVEQTQLIKSFLRKPSKTSNKIKQSTEIFVKPPTTVKENKKLVNIKKEQFEFTLPNVPESNKRKKIKSYFPTTLTALFEEFETFDESMEDEHLKQKSSQKSDNIDTDANFFCTPEIVCFDGYQIGKRYKKEIIITNKSSRISKCVLGTMKFASEYENLYFKITPLPDVMKLAAGCSQKFSINFEPEEENLLEGTLTFFSYDFKKLKRGIFWITIRCIPRYVDLKIITDHIEFGAIPFWMVATRKSKLLKFKNEGWKACFLVIKRNTNPLEIQEPSDVDNCESRGESFGDSIGERTSDNFMKPILDDICENVFSCISLEHTQILLNPQGTENVHAKLKNIEHIGSYFEKYTVDIYEESNKGPLIGSQEILFTAEITGHLLKVDPEVVDFGICFVNSVYQTGVNVQNNSSNMLTVCVKYPAQMAAYLRCDITSIYIPSGETRQILLKFLPTPSICKGESKYYSTLTSILEFPLYVFVLSKDYAAMPPAKTTAMAILAQPNSVQLFLQEEQYFQNGIFDLGNCTIYETVYTDIEIRNESPARQIYGFINLPDCITLPNSEFGELWPWEIRTVRLLFHPSYLDLSKEDKFDEKQLEFSITLETLANLGHKKIELNSKNMKLSIDLMLKQLKKRLNVELYQDIENCKIAVKKHLQVTSTVEDVLQNKYTSISTIEDEKDSNRVTLSAKISRPLLELSHQYIIFPPTPCGSYSFKEIEIKACDGFITLESGAFKNFESNKVPNYEAFFRITGDTAMIKVEPNCGILRNGEAKKIMFVAKPSAPEGIILEIAKTLKKTEPTEDSATDDTQSAKNISKRHGSITRKSKSLIRVKSSKSFHRKHSSKIALKISEIDHYDCYPAEMIYWRNMEPFEIINEFVCEIRYGGERVYKKLEKIYIQANCKMVRPDFITNLKLQRIHFGDVLIGDTKKQEIILQNIKYDRIEIKMSLLNPIGPFTTTPTKSFTIPSEHLLKLSIKFEPRTEGNFEEYFEIRSDKTTLSLVLEGHAIHPQFEFSPKFLVCRMEAPSKNGHKEFLLNIINKIPVAAKIRIDKICELEGKIDIISKETLSEKNIRLKKTDKKKKEVILSNLSDALDENEELSIKNQFKISSEPNLFQIFGTEHNELLLNADEKPEQVRFRFGQPQMLKKLESVKSKVTVKKTELQKQNFKLIENNKYYVAKYNVMLGETFIKDFIFIGCFK